MTSCKAMKELYLLVHNMDSVFLMDEVARDNFLQSLGQAVGCTYICLWSYLPPPHNYLISAGGWYKDDASQPSTSFSSSFPRRLLDAYKQCSCSIENGSVPGYAFRSGIHYLELSDYELLNASSYETQRQFYLEAGIKTAVFNGCRSGVIELGFSTRSYKDMSSELRKWFPEDFTQQYQLSEPLLPDQSRPSSSSSSLKSLSAGSPEYSSLLHNLVTASFMTNPIQETTPIVQGTTPTSSIALPTHQLTMQAYGQLCNVQFPNPASEAAAMTRAMLAVISSPSTSSSSYQTQNLAHQQQRGRQRTAFKPYSPALAPIIKGRPGIGGSESCQSKMKRMFAFLRTIRTRMQEVRSTSNQLQHMISERRRREKINDSIQSLRALLPPGTKKDKASVLSKTGEYLRILKDQVLELQERNRLMEARHLSEDRAYDQVDNNVAWGERVIVQVEDAIESSSESRQVEVRVIVREEDCDMNGLLLRLLEFLRPIQELSLVSVNGDTHLHDTQMFLRVILRLKIKTSQWDRESFKNTLTRAVGHLARGRSSIS